MKLAKIVLAPFVLLLLLSSCTQKPREVVRTDVPQYTIEQFYKNKSITG